MMTPRVVLVIGAIALALSGCGDDDDDGGGGADGGDVSDEEQPYVDAMVESAESANEDELQISPDQAECFGSRFVDIIGVDRLEEAGLTPESLAEDSDLDFSTVGLTEEEGGQLYDAFAECDVDIREEFLAGMETDASMSDEDKECVAEAFDDDLLRRIMVTTFVEGEAALEGDQEIMSDVFAVFSECPGAAPG